MAHLMVVQCSGRKNGYTANLMKAAVKRIEDMENLEVEIFHLHDYTFGPCTSCFSCIRNVGSGCVLDDDWGRKRGGVLFKAAIRTNGVLMVDPVHGWGMSAAAKLFLERFYPTFWEGIPYGMPFASISCASNQGFQYRASEDYCKFAAAHGLRELRENGEVSHDRHPLGRRRRLYRQDQHRSSLPCHNFVSLASSSAPP